MNLDTIYRGDALEELKKMPEGIFNCCITSPPYYGLRDYEVVGQIGLEPTPDEYIARLVEVFREVRRVLRKDGTMWLNIGDCYAGSSKGGINSADKKYKQSTNKGLTGATACRGVTFPNCKPKDLIGIPWMLAFALRADGWYLRQDIIWQKRNCMPESVTDRCTNSHEHIFLLSKSRKYYFAYKAIQEPCITHDPKFRVRDVGKLNKCSGKTKVAGLTHNNYAFKNKRSVWDIPIQPFKGSHFATFPPELIRPCVKASAPVGGVILDPFIGSGTTAVVALEECRRYVGIELSHDYAEIAEQRLSCVARQGIISMEEATQ